MAKAKRFNCYVCGCYAGKSKVCRDCKNEQPSIGSQPGGKPFKRERNYESKVL